MDRDIRVSKVFSLISFSYMLLLGIATGIIYIFYDAFRYEKMNGLFFYLVLNYGLDVVYFHFLQKMIKTRKYPGTSSLSALCVAVALAIGIFMLLFVGISKIEAFIVLVFFPIFMTATVFAGYRLWIHVKYED